MTLVLGYAWIILLAGRFVIELKCVMIMGEDVCDDGILCENVSREFHISLITLDCYE